MRELITSFSLSKNIRRPLERGLREMLLGFDFTTTFYFFINFFGKLKRAPQSGEYAYLAQPGKFLKKKFEPVLILL
mgnify:CR=1 FL=1